MRGWINQLGFPKRVRKKLEKEQIDTLEELYHLDDEKVNDIGRFSIPEVKARIDSEGMDNVKKQISLEAGDEIKYLDYSALLDDIEKAYFHEISVSDLGLLTRSAHVLESGDIYTLEDLLLTPAARIGRLRGMGKTSYDDILNTRHEWFIKFKREGLSEEVITRYSNDGLLYAYMLRKLQGLLEIDINKVIAYIKGEHGENRSHLNKTYDDLTKEDYLYVISNVKQIQDDLMELMDISIEPRHHGAKWSGIENIIRKMTDDPILIAALEEYYDSNLLKNGEYFYVKRPYLKDYMQDIDEDRDGIITRERLSGKKLREIAPEQGVTTERARQIVKDTIIKSIPRVMEDYYSNLINEFHIGRDEFYAIFPTADPKAYRYAVTRFGSFQHTKPDISLESVQDYDGMFKAELLAYVNKKTVQENEKKPDLTVRGIALEVVRLHGNGYMTADDLASEYAAYLEKECLTDRFPHISMRSIYGYLRESDKIVFNRKSEFRYYSKDANDLWLKIDFDKYQNQRIYALRLYEDYPDLMEEYDIRDGHELFCLLKNTPDIRKRKVPEVTFVRNPVMIIGSIDKRRKPI